jgi:RimJ/RimL family protein N-acetyltransferase
MVGFQAMPAPEIPPLESDRLILRPFVPADAPEVKRLAGDRRIADTTLNIPHPYEDGMAEKWIAAHPGIFAARQGVTFAMVLKPEGILVGAISLMHLTEGHQAELGYWVAPSFWNQGLCTEAGRLILRYAFSELNLIRVHATHLTRNPASGRVMRKLGFRHEGSRPKHRRKWDKFEDVEVYGVLKAGWSG